LGITKPGMVPWPRRAFVFSVDFLTFSFLHNRKSVTSQRDTFFVFFTSSNYHTPSDHHHVTSKRDIFSSFLPFHDTLPRLLCQFGRTWTLPRRFFSFPDGGFSLVPQNLWQIRYGLNPDFQKISIFFKVSRLRVTLSREL
jgi:hypothetical protein